MGARALTPTATETTDLAEQRRNRDAIRKLNLRVQLTYGDRTLTLARSAVGPADDRMARQQAGMTVTGVFNAGLYAAQTGNVLPIGADMALVLWWVARRKAGEHGLSYMQVEGQFPSVDDVDDIHAEWIVDTPDDDPEA
jgi:hypothetical protein